MDRRLALIGLVVALAGTAGTAFDATPPSSIPLSVVITDARGQGVRNLTPADLEVTEDGQKRAISSIKLRGPAPRVVGLLLDEFHISSGENTERARGAALRFVRDFLRPDDVLFFLRPLDPHLTLKPIGLDEVRERVLAFSGRKGHFAPRSAFEAEYMSAAEPAATRQRAQVVRSAMEALATAMREPTDAPKALILVTEGFAFEERSRTRTTTLRTTARAAALANLPVYVIDPSPDPGAEPLEEPWRGLASQTGGALLTGTTDLDTSFARVAEDLRAQFLVRFESSGKQDGGFHGIQVVSRRRGAVIRGPSGYWAPFPPSRLGPPSPSVNYASLLTPHASGLIQPWFRMSPGNNETTRVTFMWSPRRDKSATSVEFAAISFEGTRLHEAAVDAASASPATRTSFEVTPGPLQISMAIVHDGRRIDTDVRYIDVPRLDASRPIITGIEFVRPRSLPEFVALQVEPHAVPTEVRDFLRQDRLLIRVRAFAGMDAAAVRVALLNRAGHVLMELPGLPPVDGAAQFDLPFARYPRGEYRLAVRASHGAESTSQLLTIRVIG